MMVGQKVKECASHEWRKNRRRVRWINQDRRRWLVMDGRSRVRKEKNTEGHSPTNNHNTVSVGMMTPKISSRNHRGLRLKLACRRFWCGWRLWRFEEIVIINDQIPRHNRHDRIDLHIRLSMMGQCNYFRWELFVVCIILQIGDGLDLLFIGEESFWLSCDVRLSRFSFRSSEGTDEIEWCQVDLVWFSFFTTSGPRRWQGEELKEKWKYR